MQNRDADLGEFFCHEVQSFPPPLSEFGNLRLPSNKSELVKCIVQPRQAEPPTEFDCKICDGAVIVHRLPVTGVITFDDYAENVFILTSAIRVAEEWMLFGTPMYVIA